MVIRNTKQRQIIQQVLTEADRPLSVDEILEAAQREMSSLGIATVYRNVKGLVEDGNAVVVDLPGEGPRYELAGKGHHHHFRCSSCAKVFETKACMGKLRELVPRQFEITGHNLVLYGRCPDCGNRAKN
ncbi:MAG TPA: transcriptional repressor [Bryobacteraceae bacterium]|jgi:Fur family ferric uptake transcriptional regulator|nr:transcriptional repressor [Bryobacteraceae bacterium]